MRGDVLALSDGRNPIASDVRDSSRYCMVTLVFQDETAKNAVLEREYGDAIFRLGADPESANTTSCSTRTQRFASFTMVGRRASLTSLRGFSEGCPCAVVREQRVTQGNCRMLQVADFICTVKLIGLRLDAGLSLNLSEQRFFGSPRTFERNILRKIKSKET